MKRLFKTLLLFNRYKKSVQKRTDFFDNSFFNAVPDKPLATRNKPHNNQLCADLSRFISAYSVVSHFLRFAWQTTPTVDTETVQQLFIKAYNQMMGNRKQIIEDCELMRKKLTDFKSLDADIERHLEETQIVAELVKAAVKDNAVTAQSQEAYLKKYESLTKRYETEAAELARLQNLRTLRSQKDKAVALYIRTLKKQPTVLSEWNDTLWTVMVEKAIVHRNSEITFVFYNGTKVKVRQ